MDGFENKNENGNEMGNAVDAAAQNLSQAADEAASTMTGGASKATSYEEVYGTVEPQNDSTQGAEPFTGATIEYNNEEVKASANGMQIASLVLGILSIILGCCTSYIGCIFGIVGLILAILGNKQGKNGIGTAGLICSIVGIVVGIIMTILGALAIAAFGSVYDMF